ncbi:hypothetical protein DLAC_04666 [Tieghemostelium lacteum]|uniref:EGF-like domain-containing protein n=1 Tax=Tieghemostelium lacteum TaxID=361077 RepID=A0A151ZK42_TIELA|nr:hypothetical protein DLAC_04666 [Tieghemostelium lacteum]|eukprot:KYQ94368.1 hypothetical protein DLAC_04666 [Tieghemostelium lacteum]
MKRYLSITIVLLLCFISIKSQTVPSDQLESLNMLASIYSLNWPIGNSICSATGVSCDTSNNIIALSISNSIPTKAGGPIIVTNSTVMVELVDVVSGSSSLPVGGSSTGVASGSVSTSLPTGGSSAGGTSGGVVGTSGSGTGSAPTDTTGGAGPSSGGSTGSNPTGTPTISTGGAGPSSGGSTGSNPTGTPTVSTGGAGAGTGSGTGSLTGLSTGMTTGAPTMQNLTLPHLTTLNITRVLQPAVSVNIMNFISNLPALKTLILVNQPYISNPAYPGSFNSPLESFTAQFMPNLYFPDAFSQLSTIQHINFQNNNLGYNTAYQFSSSLKSLDLSYNTYSSVPQDFCALDSTAFVSNNLYSIPTCFTCHWDYTSSWFAQNPNLPSNQGNNPACTTFTANFQNGQLVSQGQVIEITGTDMGWGVPTVVTPGLAMIEPNTKFTFKIPPVSQGTSGITLKFSQTLTKDITWVYSDPIITEINIVQQSNGLSLSLTGNFLTTGTKVLKINGATVPIVSSTTTSLEAQLPSSTTEGKKMISVTTSYGVANATTLFTRTYPVVTATSIGQGKIHFYGYFANSSTANIKINNVASTNVQVVSENEVTCDFPVDLAYGASKFEFDQDGYIFISSNALYYFNPDPQCPNPCENNGRCELGKCICPDNWAGPTCTLAPIQADKQSDLTLTPNGEFSFQGIKFDFKITGIEEINYQNTVVSSHIIGEWIINQPSENVIIYTYPKPTPKFADVLVTIEVSKDPRSYEFAEQTNTLEANSIKLSMNISHWEYQSSLNHLRVILTSNLQKSQTEDNGCGSDDSSNSLNLQVGNSTGSTIKYLSMTKNGVVFYGKFLDVAISDGRVAYSPNTILEINNQSMKIGIELPKCDSCLLDPSYSILVDPSAPEDSTDNCDDSSKSRKWVVPVAVVVSVVGASAIFATVFLMKKKFYIYRSGKTIKFVSRSSGSD